MNKTAIYIEGLSLHFGRKLCFTDFSTQVPQGAKVAIIGRNGSGKSSLLKMLKGVRNPSEGTIRLAPHQTIGYVPQLIQNLDHLSGGQRFNKRLTEALRNSPDLLLLDEPTNNLDAKNRHALMKALNRFRGTLLTVPHDITLLRNGIDTYWHIEEGTIKTFSGSYDQYMAAQDQAYKSQVNAFHQLKKALKKSRKSLQFEQQRAAKSSKANRYENDRALRGAMKEKGSKTAGKNSHQKKLDKQILEKKSGTFSGKKR